jgi:prophage tail gpP-like protein
MGEGPLHIGTVHPGGYTEEPAKDLGVQSMGAPGTIIIVIGGQRYDKFTAFTLNCPRGGTCSGQITLSWPGAEMFNATNPPAQEFDECARGVVYLDGQLAASIYVDSRTSQGTPNSFQLVLAFRGRAATIIDSSPKHESGQENNKTPVEIARKLIEGHDLKIIDKTGDSRRLKRFIIGDGETITRAIHRAAREFGITFWEKPDGSLLFEKLGQNNEGNGATLRLGDKLITDWQVQKRIESRFREVDVLGNSHVDDTNYGEPAERVAASIKDDSVKCAPRYRRVFIDSDHDKDSIKQRAKHEKLRRVDQSLNVQLKVASWTDGSGKLWAVGKKHHVSIPVDQVNGPLELESVRFDLTRDTRTATLVLVDREEAANILADGKVSEPVVASDPTPSSGN